MASHHSAACCTLPIAAVSEYSPKGSWIEIDGLKTYVTGPVTSKKAIFQVYDIFGYSPQTLQGADILATKGKEPLLVFVPGFINQDSAAKSEWFQSEEGNKLLQVLLASIYSEQMTMKILKTLKSLKSDEKYAHIDRWAGLGFCWGSKMLSSIVAKEGESFFNVLGHSSPSKIDPDEAIPISIPTIMLASKDEDASDVRKYIENLKGDKYVETFAEVHGFMSARGFLDKEGPRKAYERGYQLLLDFFAKHL